MRTTLKTLFLGIGLGSIAATPAASQVSRTAPGVTVTCVVTAVVQSFVRVVTHPGTAQTGGVPTVEIVSNDPRLRRPPTIPTGAEVLAKGSVVYETTGRGHGGEAGVPGEATATPTVVRFTVALP